MDGQTRRNPICPAARWWALVALALLLGCPKPAVDPPEPRPPQSRYILMIDAGSSGSRLYAYRFQAAHGDRLPEITLAHTQKVQPGISAFEEDPGLGRKNIERLIQAALEVIPPDLRPATPIYLLATAGMRMLSQAKQNRILSAIEDIFQSAGSFDYQKPMVLSGAFEGLYSWLAVNYLDDRFDPVAVREGLLEMGGASTQVAFMLTDEHTASTIVRSIRGRQYRVHVKSYLYMGENQARQLAATPNCYPKGFPLGIGEGKGQGDFQLCAKEIRERFTGLCESLECDGPHCIFAHPPIRAPQGDYFAVSGFYYLYDFLAGQVGKKLLPVYFEDGQDFCSKEWEAIKVKYSAQKDDSPYLKNYCFASAYYWSILSQGFGFNEADHRIMAVNKINATEVSWTLGAALDLFLGHTPQAH